MGLRKYKRAIARHRMAEGGAVKMNYPAKIGGRSVFSANWRSALTGGRKKRRKRK